MRFLMNAEPFNIIAFLAWCHDRRPPVRRTRGWWAVFSLLLLTSCSTTGIPPTPPAEPVFRLASANQTVVYFRVAAPGRGIYGHQYLGAVLPFGRVEVERPDADLRAAVFQALATRGYRPIEVPASAVLPPLGLEFSLSDLQLSAYDALFFRIPYCRFTLGVVQSNGLGQERKRAQGGFSDYATRAMAFTPELQPLYYETLASAAATLIAELSL